MTTDDEGQVRESTHVVVLGAGMAGLAAAAAAAAAADHVTVVERDSLPVGAEHRRGVPQDRHIHALLAGGREALDDLLPGFDAGLSRRGAPEVTHGGGFGFRSPHGWLQHVPELTIRCASRPVIEATARELVRRREDIELLEQWEVRQPTVDAAGRIAGVTGVHDGQPARLAADLVIDTTGRGSVTPAWLDELGYDAPPEQVVDPDLWYATTIASGTPDLPDGMQALVMGPTEDIPGGGGMIPAGDGSYVVSLTGVGARDRPRTVDDFRAYARRLPSPVIARAIAPAELDGDIVSSRSTANRVRRYDRVDLPEGLVLLGDSVCALDPIYGQGMTVAAIQARALRGLLSEVGLSPSDLGSRFQERAWSIAKLAWDQAVAADRRLPTVDRPVPLAVRPVAAYLERVGRLCAVDPEVARRVGRVLHLLDPPTGMFHPSVLVRVARDLLRPVEVPPHPADEHAASRGVVRGRATGQELRRT